MKRHATAVAFVILAGCNSGNATVTVSPTPPPSSASPSSSALVVRPHSSPSPSRASRGRRAGAKSAAKPKPHGGSVATRHPLSDRALARLRSCEGAYTSHGNPPYYGAYQYYWTPTRGTWRSLWLSWGDPRMANTRPDRAPAAVQDATIRRHWLAGANPYSQWPGCTRALGAWWAL